ncbi:protein kinase [Chlorogloeopsis sp. ULAP01]|uniref:serine/threonine protein kinase n=1 Tax=Chlorogloeopsis sp. ULAP01 TaxID=3056483 RepID=UPI0025AAD703|nr:serine/threonine protein kinase [Chlorogloeopsis sp. ULAP01]MDM9381844.1 protein kinase [Chlorogloeopsis sp. ULAP01]
MTKLLNNRYQVIQVLGVGGFSETFLAEDTHLPSRRRCVIKQLKPITNDPKIYPKIQRRFEREATTLEYLGEGSEQIPKLYAYFSENGQFYLVQEWIKGQTLSSLIKTQSSVGETAVREILLSLLPVLDYIHSKGIIHRDIKPDNIILRNPYASSIPPYQRGVRGGEPVLIDFGAVKETIRSVENSPGYTTQSLVMGTPGYMPSEQVVGRPVYATDIYSLGLTAIYLLTGKHPRELKTNPQTGEILWQHHAPGVSPQLAMILNRAIKPQASDRYTTASKMLDALQSYSPPTPKTTIAIQPIVTSLPTFSAASQETQLLPSNQNAPVTLTYSIPRKWQKPTWIVGSLVVASLIGTLAIVNITRKPESAHSPILPTPTPLSTDLSPAPESPAPTSEEANPPVNSQSPPKQQQSNPVPSVPTPSEPEDTAEFPVASAPPATVSQPQNNVPRNQSSRTIGTQKVPGFSVGTQRSTVEAALGKPSQDSRGIWRNTRAVSYILVPNRIHLGYLFDRNSGRIRQTEVAFAQSIDFQVMLTTLEGMLGRQVTEEIRQGLLQVRQRRLDNFRFAIGSLKGQIVRQECGLIYISVWDSDLHDFVNPADARKC